MAKTAFTVISPVPEIPAGTSRTIEVQYRNDGAVTVYNAQARITPHNPVTITDNNAFLGDLKPGETASARYEIQADADAEPKMYSFDSTIRYRDALGNSQESDTLPVRSGCTAVSGIGSRRIPCTCRLCDCGNCDLHRIPCLPEETERTGEDSMIQTDF